jgi:hypothetical protein
MLYFILKQKNDNSCLLRSVIYLIFSLYITGEYFICKKTFALRSI